MILDDIVAKKRLDLEKSSLQISLTELERKASKMPNTRDFHSSLGDIGLSVIAEVKRSSPSQGMLTKDFDYRKIASTYEQGGASAISVLTEQHFFQGSDLHLTEVKELVSLPVLRKDFIIAERQVVESKAIGADAILLIAGILDSKTLYRLYNLASDYGLHCLFEAHNEDEVKRSFDCGAKIIGINNRNLKTLEIDILTFERLRGHIPSDTLVVAESGIKSIEDAKRMKDAGADAILVGGTLMRAKDPGALIKAFSAP
ncbi:MAG: indole-3-glycerol phosphate synthase [Gracilibacter sp. BRH_c7a]|nr:MAG: indole-3-glycerol phosphate synthase [Gracilibacter sp. BRH_c7a]